MEYDTKIKTLLGFKINCFDMEEAIEYAFELINSRKGGQVITINPEMIETASKNSLFKELISKAEIVLPDGIGIKLGFKLKGINISRVAGIEFAYNLLKKCEEKKYPIALVGAKPHVVSSASKNLQKNMPDLKIIYTHNGYFKDDEKIITNLKRNAPKLVLVALGSPRQEFFIQKAREEMPSTLFVGVGGSFDVWGGYVERAPESYQKLGLEWLYRTVKEPQRIKRIFPTLPKFMLKVLLCR